MSPFLLCVGMATVVITELYIASLGSINTDNMVRQNHFNIRFPTSNLAHHNCFYFGAIEIPCDASWALCFSVGMF